MEEAQGRPQECWILVDVHLRKAQHPHDRDDTVRVASEADQFCGGAERGFKLGFLGGIARTVWGEDTLVVSITERWAGG